MTDEPTTALKPCPFCGNEKPKLYDNSDDGHMDFYVICQLNCVWGPSRSSAIEAAEAWNARKNAMPWLIKSQSLLTNVKYWVEHGQSETAVAAIEEYWKEWRQ